MKMMTLPDRVIWLFVKHARPLKCSAATNDNNVSQRSLPGNTTAKRDVYKLFETWKEVAPETSGGMKRGY